MWVIADVSVVPIGVGVSLSTYVAACQRVLEEAGLEHHLHASGTNLAGDWDDVMAAVKRCHEVVHELGAPRIATTLKLGTRHDRLQSIEERLDAVADKLMGSPPAPG